MSAAIPIRLTRRRADALLAVFAIGASDVEEALREGLRFSDLLSADEMQVLRERDAQLAAARDAAAIVAARYAGGPVPTEPNPTLF